MNRWAVCSVVREHADIVDALALPYVGCAITPSRVHFLVDAGDDDRSDASAGGVIESRYFPTRGDAEAWMRDTSLREATPAGGVQ